MIFKLETFYFKIYNLCNWNLILFYIAKILCIKKKYGEIDEERRIGIISTNNK